MNKIHERRRSRAAALVTLVAVLTLAALAAPPTQAATYTQLYDFCSQTACADGARPLAALMQASDGNFYGTTYFGGDTVACPTLGCGTLFKLTPSGALTTIYSFSCTLANCTDGIQPGASLIQATDGDFYGITSGDGGISVGTVFKITASGTLTTLHNFQSCSVAICTDGEFPQGVIEGTDGNFYGTTSAGGDNQGNELCAILGCGTVFKITPTGTTTILHIFEVTDGQGPAAPLIQATDGNFYGTTEAGGTNFAGTVYKITPSGALTTLYSFCSQTDCTDGRGPDGALIQGADGNFYGTTYYGGGGSCAIGTPGCGTVFKITPSGTLTTLHSFDGTDGAYPAGRLVQATDGNFYGTTFEGGGHNQGTVFEMTPSGTLTTLHDFFGASSGRRPAAGLIQATNGDFYGVTSQGVGNGAYHGGVFRVSTGLGRFVMTQTTTGGVGSRVVILGNYLVGATRVTFNGTAAPFTVVSASEITTTVPAGATSGFVEVTKQSGLILRSNAQFTVTP